MDFAEKKRKALINLMQRYELKVTAWARSADVREGTLRSFLSGRTRSMRADTEHKLAKALNLTASQMYGESNSTNATTEQVWVKGVVGAGAIIMPLDGMGNGEGIDQVERPPGSKPEEQLEGYRVKGESMPPFDDGAIVYVEVSDAIPGAHLFGKLCIVETRDGEKYLKKVERGYNKGRYNLRSWNGNTLMENTQLLRAAPVLYVKMAD